MRAENAISAFAHVNAEITKQLLLGENKRLEINRLIIGQSPTIVAMYRSGASSVSCAVRDISSFMFETSSNSIEARDDESKAKSHHRLLAQDILG